MIGAYLHDDLSGSDTDDRLNAQDSASRGDYGTSNTSGGGRGRWGRWVLTTAQEGNGIYAAENGGETKDDDAGFHISRELM